MDKRGRLLGDSIKTILLAELNRLDAQLIENNVDNTVLGSYTRLQKFMFGWVKEWNAGVIECPRNEFW